MAGLVNLRRLTKATAALTALLAFASVNAEDLPDPTRPPAALGMNAEDAAGYQGPGLQSIYVSPSRREATVDGQPVKVGGKIGEATVIGITDDAVIVREGKELRTLRLFPNLVEMRALPAASRKTGEKNHGQNAKD